MIFIAFMAFFASNSTLTTFPSFKLVASDAPKCSKIVSFHPDTFDVLKDTLFAFPSILQCVIMALSLTDHQQLTNSHVHLVNHFHQSNNQVYYQWHSHYISLGFSLFIFSSPPFLRMKANLFYWQFLNLAQYNWLQCSNSNTNTYCMSFDHIFQIFK